MSGGVPPRPSFSLEYRLDCTVYGTALSQYWILQEVEPVWRRLPAGRETRSHGRHSVVHVRSSDSVHYSVLLSMAIAIGVVDALHRVSFQTPDSRSIVWSLVSPVVRQRHSVPWLQDKNIKFYLNSVT